MPKTDIIIDGTQEKEIPILIEILDALDKDLTHCRVAGCTYHIEGWETVDGIRTVTVHKEEPCTQAN